MRLITNSQTAAALTLTCRDATHKSVHAKPASRWVGLLVAAGVAAPGLARAQPVDLYFERAVMAAAGNRAWLGYRAVLLGCGGATMPCSGRMVRNRSSAAIGTSVRSIA